MELMVVLLPLFCMPALLGKVIGLITDQELVVGIPFTVAGVVAFALALSYIKPPVDFDLYRHYAVINAMRFRDWNYAINYSRYSYLPVATLLFYIVSRTPWNSLLVFISVATNLGLFEYAAFHYRKRGCSERYICIGFFMFLALSDLVLMVSGIRNVLAATLVGFGIWYYESKSSSKVYRLLILALFTALGIGIHPATISIIAVWFISKAPSLTLSSMLSLSFISVSIALANAGIATGVPLIDEALSLLVKYSAHDFSMRRLSGLLSPPLVIILLINQINDWHVKGIQSSYDRFAITYTFGVVGAFQLQIATMRMLYGLSFVTFHMIAQSEEKLSLPRLFMILYCILYAMALLQYQIRSLSYGYQFLF